MNLRDSFIEQAGNCEDLGSPFTAGLLRMLAEKITATTPIGARVLNWPNDPSYRTDVVGLRLAGALHALVLQDVCPELTAVYPPNNFDKERLWQAVQKAFHTHEARIMAWLDLPPQTNEVRRSAALIPACLSLQNHFNKPLVLSELGASAGLNLNWDRFRLTLNGTEFGNTTSKVHLKPDWSGPLPPNIPPHVIAKAGCDLNPLDPAHDALRLRSYIWPDQINRVARTNEAINIALKNPPLVKKSDVTDWLHERLSHRHKGVVHVICHTIAWQYFPTDTQKLCEDLICKAGQKALDEAPIAWLGMEADNKPDGANISVTYWPNGETQNLGRIDFHGRWVKWSGMKS